MPSFSAKLTLRFYILLCAFLPVAASFSSCQKAETKSTENSKPPKVAASPDSAADAPKIEPPRPATDSVAVTDTTRTDTATVTKSRVIGPELLPGSILPNKRIVAYYGNPLSKRMGIMGELPVDQMLAKLDGEVAAWEKADPTTPVQPALHLIAVTAQGQPGKGGKYRLRMAHKLIDRVLEMAAKRDAIVFLDIQVGRSTLQAELPMLEKYFKMPNVHLGIDAEFAMGETGVPGRRVGSFDAEDVNYAAGYLANLVKENNLPPKVFVVHRFTQRMITNHKNIKLRPEVQIVMHMDGWGDIPLKKDTYRRYIQKEPVQYTGFKLFYKNDVKKPGWKLMKPEQILKLKPQPLYIQYQ